MNLPSFDQFMDSLEPDYLTKVATQSVRDNSENDHIDYAGLILVSCNITVKLLNRYHAWLSQQLAGLPHDD